ncbi:hypothetical protein MANI_024038 [Metarhizium anisopliae]|nr:hypothetical protein MANI_024038 [Metarhizium anisopliae]
MKFGVVIFALSATAMAYENLAPRGEGLAPRDDQCKKNGEKCHREELCCSKYCEVWENQSEVSIETAFSWKAVRTLTRRYQGTCKDMPHKN